MRFDILTIFPGMFVGPFDESILKRAQQKGVISIYAHNIRDFAHDKHHTTDDYPYGGGAGMVMKPEPIFAAVEAVKSQVILPEGESTEIILLSPSGRLFTGEIAKALAEKPHVILICGRYEGVDERVREHLATDEISIGDYVLSGGELPAMVLVDAISRHVPGVLGAAESTLEESFELGLLEYPQYTRPSKFEEWEVPEILLSGNHGAIARWRRQQALKRTLERRPDLLSNIQLDAQDRAFVESLKAEER